MACNYLPMLGLKLAHVRKRGNWRWGVRKGLDSYRQLRLHLYNSFQYLCLMPWRDTCVMLTSCFWRSLELNITSVLLHACVCGVTRQDIASHDTLYTIGGAWIDQLTWGSTPWSFYSEKLWNVVWILLWNRISDYLYRWKWGPLSEVPTELFECPDSCPGCG